MPELANVWVGVGADISQFQRKMDKVGSRVRSAGKSMTSAGKTMTKGLTLPIAGAAAGVASMASDFQKSMNTVEAVTQPTAKQMAAMEKQAKQLGRTTQFSASEAADGMTMLGRAGLDATQQMEALPGVLDLAAAGQLELGRASDITTDVMSGFGLQVSDVAHVNDVLAETASSANTSVEGLGQAMAQVAPVAAASGVSVEEASAAAGLLASSGIKASRAGTQLRAAIAKMENQSGPAKKAMDDLGVSFTDAEGDIVGLSEAVERMNDAGASTSDVMQIFGRRAGTAIAALMEQGAPAIEEFTGRLGDAQGRAKEMADTQMQGLPGALKRLKSAFEGAMLAIADAGVIDFFVDLAEKVTGFMRSLAEVNPMILKVGVAIAGVVAVAGPLLAAVGAMVSAIGSLLPVVAALAGPIGAVVAAVGGLTAALVTAYTKSETFRDIVNAAFGKVREDVGEIVGWLSDRLSDIGEFFGLTRTTVVDEVKEMSNEAVADTVDMTQRMTDEVRGLARDGKQLSGELANEWIANVRRMRDKAVTAAKEEFAKRRETANNLAVELDSISASAANDVVMNARDQRDQTVQANREMADGVERRIKGLRDEGVTVTDQMASQIARQMRRQRDEVVEAVADQERQATNVLSRLQAEAGKISVDMAAKAIRESAKQRDQTVSTAKDEYRKRVDQINRMASESEEFTEEMRREAIREARRQRDDSISAAKETHQGVVDEIKGMRRGVEDEVDLQTGKVLSEFDKLKNGMIGRIKSAATNLGVHYGGAMTTIVTKSIEMKNDVKGHIDDVVGFFAALPGRITGALGGLGQLLVASGRSLIDGLAQGVRSAVGSLGSALSDAVSSAADAIPFVDASGDGPGMPIPGAGGSTRNRVQAAMRGLPLSITSGYRTPSENAAAGGSPTSYHMDKSNPAVDVGGPTWALDMLNARLQRMGGWRELLWRTAGHFDHVHVAHQGGRVTPRGMEPLRSDEVLSKLKVGETVRTRQQEASLGATYEITVNNPRPETAEESLSRQMRRLESVGVLG
jgi:TP901 family phage tail tape measure protein